MWVRSRRWEEPPGGGNGNPLQYSCLENSMDRAAWWVTVHEVAKSGTRLSTHTHTTKWNSRPERLAHGVPRPVKGQRRFLEKGTLNLRDKESVAG